MIWSGWRFAGHENYVKKMNQDWVNRYQQCLEDLQMLRGLKLVAEKRREMRISSSGLTLQELTLLEYMCYTKNKTKY